MLREHVVTSAHSPANVRQTTLHSKSRDAHVRYSNGGGDNHLGTMSLQGVAPHCIKDIQVVVNFQTSFVFNAKAAGAEKQPLGVPPHLG